MNIVQAKELVRDTFTHAFDRERFRRFVKEILNRYDDSKASSWSKQYIPDAFKEHVDKYERLGTFTAAGGEKVDILVVHLTRESKLERARTALRNFVAHHLKARDDKDSGLVAFVSPSEQTWRFSFVKMEYITSLGESGRVTAATSLTPARRYSYLVGEGESCHTAQSRFLAILQDTSRDPSLEQLAECFSVETVTKEFYGAYYNLFLIVDKALQQLTRSDSAVREEFRAKKVSTADFAKKLLGQIVFLYFIQKKGWLGVDRRAEWGTGPKDFLRRMANRQYGTYANFFNDRLEQLFYDTLATDRGVEAWCSRFNCRVPFLNGGLFEPLGDYDWRSTDVALPNNVFTNQETTSAGDVGTGILDVFDRYNFTVNEAEPLEQEVAIDPEMLGKVFENLIEENLRKGLGTFYTPREIVHYMCQESLISYLYRAVNTEDVPLVSSVPIQEGFFEQPKAVQTVLASPALRERISRDDLAALIHSGEQAAHYEAARKSGTSSYRAKLPSGIEKLCEVIDEKLRDVTICDPAIGSGAFPVGMMSEIVRARLALTPYFTDADERTPYHFKRQAIQNCLYGVDIDHGAVEIAKLRLWLSLVVDEEDLKHIKPLPNLDFKIVSGNSLLGFPFQSHGLTEIETLKVQYFDEPNHDRKARLKEKIEQRIQSHLASSERSLGYRVDFDFRLFFSEVVRDHGGFDVVLANPPYVRQEEIKDLKPFLKTYKCYSGTADLYVYYYERGFELLREGGVLCFISSNKYFRANYGTKLREFLSSRSQILQLIDFGDAPVFEAIAYPSIILIRRPLTGSPLVEQNVTAFTWEPGPPLKDFPSLFPTKSFPIQQRELSADTWRLEPATLLRLLDRIRRSGTALGDYCKGRFYWGIKTGFNEAFVVNQEIRDRLIAEDGPSKEVLKPFLRGRDVKRWRIDDTHLWLIFIPWHFPLHRDSSIKGASRKAEAEFEKSYPAVFAHLRGFKKELQSRNKTETGIRYEWYALQRCAATYLSEFEQPKIIVPAISDVVNFAPDFKGYFANNKATIFVPERLSVPLAVANSQVAMWFARQMFATKQGGFLDFEPRYSSQIPIPVTSPEQEMLIERITDYLIRWNSNGLGDGQEHILSFFEQLLNGLVYELFFEREMHLQSLFMFRHLKEARPPDLKALTEESKDGNITEFYQRVSELNHPIRSCLFSLRSLEVVRIIEGEE